MLTSFFVTKFFELRYCSQKLTTAKGPPENDKMCFPQEKRISIIFRWWNFKYLLFSPPNLGKMNPFWRSYLSNGLVQPPTRYCCMKIGFCILMNQHDFYCKKTLELAHGIHFIPYLLTTSPLPFPNIFQGAWGVAVRSPRTSLRLQAQGEGLEAGIAYFLQALFC